MTDDLSDTFVKALPDLTLVVSRDGLIISSLGGRELGVPTRPGALCGKTLPELWSTEVAIDLTRLIRRVLKGRTQAAGQYILENRCVEVRVRPQGVDRALVVVRVVPGDSQTQVESTLADAGGRRDATDCELFARKFCDAIAKAQLQEKPVALAVIHFDALPGIMSAFGSAASRLLVVAARERISALDLTPHVTRGKSLRITQLESDQLAVLIEDPPDPEAAARAAEIIFRSAAQTIELDGQRHALNPTVGLALFPDDGHEPETLLDRARGAILEAHRSGRQSRVATASETAGSGSISSTDLEKEVRWAVQGEQFVLQYAPVVELVGRRTVTLVTSLRWDHPMRGLVPPEQFMPLLDKLDLRSTLDRWILRRASGDLAHWSERGSTRVSLGIKLTRQAMATEDFVVDVAAAAAAADIRLSRLDFDIDAKTLAMGSRVRGQLRELRKQGARVFLEDFGADGIALGRLSNLPLDGVKIAPEFVAQLDRDAGARAVCRSAVSIARSFGLKCVAAGVTRHSQLDFLRDCSCELVMGPLLGPPQPASEFHVVGAGEPDPLPLEAAAR